MAPKALSVVLIEKYMSMIFTKTGNPLSPLNIKECISVQDFLREGEYDQDDCGLISYDDLYDYIESLKK